MGLDLAITRGGICSAVPLIRAPRKLCRNDLPPRLYNLLCAIDTSWLVLAYQLAYPHPSLLLLSSLPRSTLRIDISLLRCTKTQGSREGTYLLANAKCAILMLASWITGTFREDCPPWVRNDRIHVQGTWKGRFRRAKSGACPLDVLSQLKT